MMRRRTGRSDGKWKGKKEEEEEKE